MTRDLLKFKVGNLVLLENCNKENWDAKHMTNFCICKIINDKAYYLQNPCGHIRHAAVAAIQLLRFFLQHLYDFTKKNWNQVGIKPTSFASHECASIYWTTGSIHSQSVLARAKCIASSPGPYRNKTYRGKHLLCKRMISIINASGINS